MKVCQESLRSFVIIVFKLLNNVILTELKIENIIIQFSSNIQGQKCEGFLTL